MPAATLLACRKEGLLFALRTRSDSCIPRKKLRGLVPSFHIHVSVSDLYISTIDRGNVLIAYRYMNLRMGTRPRSFISGNVCFEFSVQCLRSTILGTLRGSLLAKQTG
jgi:hypothetical protein